MVVLLLTVLVIAILFGVFLFVSIQRKNRMERALTSLKSGDYEEALRLFTDLYRRNSNDKKINWYLGVCHENLNNLELALVEYNKVALSTTFLPPLNEAEIHERIAMVCLKLNNIEKAMQEFKIVTSLDPENANAFYNLGIIKKNGGQMQEAITSFSKAVKCNDNFIQAHLELGKLDYALNYIEKAKKTLQKVVKLDPSLSEGHFYYALVLEKSRNFKKGIEEFQIALQDEHFAFESYAHLGYIHIELANTVQAFEYFEKALDIGSTNTKEIIELKYQYANYLVDAGEINKALQLWKEVETQQANYKDTSQKIDIYGEVGRSENLTRLMTSSKNEFLAAGMTLCRLLRIRVESHKFGKENFVEFKGTIRQGREEVNCIVHFARWTSQVGELPVRELLEKMAEENAGKGFFISTSQYSAKALKHAKVRPINLIDRDKLEEMLTKVYS